jgi:8-oxo-dGTP diphosphatase
MSGLDSIDWRVWTPTDRATLLFIIEGGVVEGGVVEGGVVEGGVAEGGRILLIEKKRGLGAGKINAPGGRLEPGETPIEAAVRELKEEIGVEATNVREHGELSFAFVDGYNLHCHVFRADTCVGQPIETDEANPFWVPLAEIPYPKMWADDATWLPHLIAGDRFRGRYVFDGDAMLAHELEVL